MYATEHYINQAAFAARIRVVPQAVPNRLATGLLLPPDVIVGHVMLAGKAIKGWTPARVKLYLEFTAPYATAAGLRLPDDIELPDWWHIESEWYLNQREAAKVLGLQPGSVSVRRTRGTFPVRPRVTIGTKLHGQAHGWDHADLIEYGDQDVYLIDGQIADKGQKGPPRKSVRPDFYRDRSRNPAKIPIAA